VTISEVYDPQAGLVAPAGPAENFADSLRWKAGPLLGGLDWLLEELTGWSAIAELVEPIAGDWTGLEKGAQAWHHAADASSAVGANYAAAAQDVVAGWVGEAADAFSARAREIADTFTQYADGCSAMGEVTSALLDLCKATAESIAGILGFFGDYLTRALVEASIPIAGWVVGAIDGAISGSVLLVKFERGYRLIQKVLDAIENFREVIIAIDRLAYTITLLMKSVTSLNNVRTVDAGGGAASTAFGVS
jgi:uncharacterized protein YukE